MARGKNALDTEDMLNKVVFFGSKLKENIRPHLTEATISMSINQVAQLSLTFMDPGFDHLKSDIYKVGIPVKFEDLMLEVGSLDTQEFAGNEQVSVRCRSRVVRRLKKRKGRRVLKDASPTEFVEKECKAVGAKVVAQKTSKRKQVARDVKGKRSGDNEDPSSWTTFQRLAAEVGFVLFEIAGTVYFGKPSWLLERSKGNAVIVNWRKGGENTWPLNVPECTVSADGDEAVTVSLTIPRRRANQFRPGKALKLNGVPNFEDHYLIQQVDYSLLGDGPITVVAGTPIDPEKLSRPGGGRGRGGRGGLTTNSLRDLLKHVGFKGEGLEIAIAVVMAESGGDPKALNKRDAGGKWGPSVGIFQIRSLKNPGQYSRPDSRRIRAKLNNPIYNAKLAFDLSNGGKDWGAWAAYDNGSYRKFYRTKKNYKVKGWSPPPSARPKDDGVARRGTKSAYDFVQFALRQSGDRYIYGAEAGLNDRNPNAWDCSELVQWAAHQVGVFIPDGSSAQIAHCRGISVEQAIRTRGALLWHSGHIAISLGNGRTIEAANPGFGVGQIGARGRFHRGGLIPGLRYR